MSGNLPLVKEFAIENLRLMGFKHPHRVLRDIRQGRADRNISDGCAFWMRDMNSPPNYGRNKISYEDIRMVLNYDNWSPAQEAIRRYKKRISTL